MVGFSFLEFVCCRKISIMNILISNASYLRSLLILKWQHLARIWLKLNLACKILLHYIVIRLKIAYPLAVASCVLQQFNILRLIHLTIYFVLLVCRQFPSLKVASGKVHLIVCSILKHTKLSYVFLFILCTSKCSILHRVANLLSLSMILLP